MFKAVAQDDYLATTGAILASIPFSTGITTTRWLKGTEVMLEKKKEVIRVDKLRTVLLFEADFNMNNKILQQRTMRQGEELEILAPEQGGSRNNFRAIYVALDKKLSIDLCRQKKIPGAVCSNDAKSCYDRIVHSVASLSMQRMGVPKEPLVCMFTTIANLEHNIRTAYGDSLETFGGELYALELSLNGVGQGNGAGPAFGRW